MKKKTIPKLTLKKKHNSIAYHRVREAVAAGVMWIAKESSDTNIADMFTKLLPSPRLKEFVKKYYFN